MQFAPLTRLSLVRRATFTTSTSKIPLLISPAEYKNLPKVGLRLLHSASLMPCSSNSLESLLKKGVDDGTLALQSTTVPLDVSWHMPNSRRSALAEYLTGPRIPGARRFDLDEVAELDLEKSPLSLTHMLPSAERFREACRESP